MILLDPPSNSMNMILPVPPILPSLKISSNRTEEEELEFQSKSGLKNRLEKFILKKNLSINPKDIKKKYEDRLDHELSIIKKMGFVTDKLKGVVEDVYCPSVTDMVIK